jgi:hypothetical protein
MSENSCWGPDRGVPGLKCATGPKKTGEGVYGMGKEVPAFAGGEPVEADQSGGSNWENDSTSFEGSRDRGVDLLPLA